LIGRKTPHNLIYVSVHYTKCPVEKRELWSQHFSEISNKQKFKRTLAHLFHSTVEIVFIATCNRFDVVFSLLHLQHSQSFQTINQNFNPIALQDVFIQEFSSIVDLDGKFVSEILEWEWNLNAYRKLLRVASSLDSLVVGEPHILGQVKDSFFESQKFDLSSTWLQHPFEFAFKAAKRVRHESELGKSGVSIGHAAVELTRKMYDDFANVSVLMIGAGEMARISCQHFLSRGLSRLTIASRSKNSADALKKLLLNEYSEFEDQVLKIETCTLQNALDNLEHYHIVLVATSSQNFLVLEKHNICLRKRKHPLPLMLVDISVPRNIDPAFVKHSESLLFDVDDLEKVMEKGKEQRASTVLRAEQIVTSALQELSNFLQQAEELSEARKHIAMLFSQTYEKSMEQSHKKGSYVLRNKFTQKSQLFQRKIVARSLAKKAILPFVHLLKEKGSEVLLETIKLLHAELYTQLPTKEQAKK
jgi:glutamyl-tRNA reductase